MDKEPNTSAKKEDAATGVYMETPESGLTWRSALAIIFGGIAMLPVAIYISLVAGIQLSGPSVYIVVILFGELAALMGRRLSKQEVFIIYAMIGSAMAGMAGVYNPIVNLVFRSYFINFPGTWAFVDPFSGKNLPLVMPPWWAPHYGSEAYLSRSLFHPQWALPLTLLLITSVTWALQEIALTFICTYLYVEEEKLPFPFAQADAQMITIMAEAEPYRMRIFTVGVLGSMVYALILYALPIISGGGFSPIPVPWIDLTTGLFGIENTLPGAFFAIATDPSSWVIGFLIPPHMAAYMTIGSLAIWMFGNYLTRTSFASLFPDWAMEWRQGMSGALVYQRSTLRVWIVPQIMFTVGISIVIIIKGRRYYVRAFKSLSKLSSLAKRTGYLGLPTLLAMYFLGSVLSIILFHYLVPEFPIWIAVAISIGFSFLNAVVATRGVGETGFQVSFPYIWLGAILLSGHKGVNAWLISPNIGGYSVPAWTSMLKVAYLTNTRIISFFKAYILAFVIYILMSYIYTNFFWSMAPIPSQAYPYVNINWPVSALSQALWMSGGITLNFNAAVYSFVLILMVAVVGELIGKFTPIPFSLIGLGVGLAMLPAYSIPFLVGSILGNYIIRRYVGNQWWSQYRPIIVASVLAGTGIVVALSAALIMILKATWILPW
jgi:hypothetical protein